MGIQKTSNGKYRVQVQVRGRGRKGCTVETYDDAVLAEPPEAEEVVAEAVIAEPVIADIEVVDTDAQYRRPEKKEEPVIDLSKPEVQDAEMVDDDE